ncbi:ATP-grasp domain-containing protein [Lentzea sp. HUAS12]|uniref:ATP-grasp domain-containing protein n=1 Tax=Lentzea sp. HUAS12 TaxID=2951806 RepID=UPI00209F3197|nr:ATP-grasp domain-containing protein [Lentzea sp. HUAS12]USX53395.1 ATP-grasp domain-containing protein [Lentzea sp. HUAS12]
MELPLPARPASPKTLLLVGSGYQIGHEHLLSHLGTAADVVLLDVVEPTWQKPWVTDFETYDPDAHPFPLEQARKLVERHDVKAVITYNEPDVLLAAQLAEALGIPGLPVRAAEICRDKLRQREVLAELSPTVSVLVHDVEEGLEVAEQIGYPLIVKPRALSGSAGVCRIDDPEDFVRYFRLAADIDKKGMVSDGILIEEFLDGVEFDVDVWSSGGKAEVLYWCPKSFDFDPHPIEIGYVCGEGALDIEPLAEGFALACAAVLAVGIDRTLSHVEVKMTSKGPRIIELNGRPGGDMLSKMVHMAFGLSIGSLLVSAALGEELEAEIVPDLAAGLKFLYPQRPQLFEGLAEAPDLRAQPWVHQVGELRPRGTVIEPPPIDFWGRAGWVIVTGTHADEVRERLAEAGRRLAVEGPYV